jgi:hypothetical protein
LLLGIFFLYNPFIALGMSGGRLAVVHHPVSYRATLASSELGCATLQAQKEYLAPLKILVAEQRAVLRQPDESRSKPAEQPVRAITQEFVASLWFRPPPVL